MFKVCLGKYSSRCRFICILGVTFQPTHLYKVHVIDSWWGWKGSYAWLDEFSGEVDCPFRIANTFFPSRMSFGDPEICATSSPTTCLTNLRCDVFVGDRAGIVGKRRVFKSFLSATTTGYKKMRLAFVGVGLQQKQTLKPSLGQLHQIVAEQLHRI